MINQDVIIENTKQFVKSTLMSAEGGHDWFHVERVLKTAVYIAKKESKNQVVLWGTGTPKRELIYVDDLADACVFFLGKSFLFFDALRVLPAETRLTVYRRLKMFVV